MWRAIFDACKLLFIAAGVIILPTPGIGARLLNGVGRFPTKFAFRLTAVGIACGDVAGAPWFDFVCDFVATGFAERGDDFKDRHSLARTEVIGSDARASMGECCDVTAREIDDVNIVAYTGAIGCAVIITKYTYGWESADGNFRYVR